MSMLKPRGVHKKPSAQHDIEEIVKYLQKNKVLSPQKDARCHVSFPKPKSLLHNKTKSELLMYIEDNLQ